MRRQEELVVTYKTRDNLSCDKGRCGPIIEETGDHIKSIRWLMVTEEEHLANTD